MHSKSFSFILLTKTNLDFEKSRGMWEGLNPETKDYLTTGFTITMWVKFLDKVSEGTLFNFGNPTRDENPFGFKLETYVLNKNDGNFTPNSVKIRSNFPVKTILLSIY